MSLKDASGYAVFEAMYDYVPAGIGELELRLGDQCFVLKPVGDPQGWLEGVNMRSKEHGQFPGTYCKVLDYHAAPPRPKKPPSVRGSSQMSINGHNVEKIHVVKPIWCFLCDDYIWGGGKVSLICSGCLLCAHSGCHQLFSSFLCSEVTGDMVKPKKELQKPIYDWMPDEVLEWMVAARLHPYINLFSEKQLFGKDLGVIDEQFLSELGIEFSFHIQLFKLCIEELMEPAPTAKDLAASIPLNESIDIQSHPKLHDHTFTTLQLCHICGKPMFGIFRQGIMCAICGMQCHRPCAFKMNNRQCTGSNSKGRRSSVSDDPSFCCNFNTTVIPPVMRKCIEAVEEFGLTTSDIYSKQITYEQFQLLKSALNQNPDMVNMRDEYWNDPGCAAHVLKTFLLELPMPLLPVELYDEFINLAVTGVISAKSVSEIWGKLSDANRSHLDYLLKHLIKLSSYCDSNGMTFEKIASQFSFLIVRPHDNEASKFIANLHYHEKIVYSLLSVFDQLESASQQKNEDFESEKWLWADGTRKDVSQCLLGTPDGTFLVRPSEARKGEWTLTVRKEGKDRLIKIITRDGLYGFREDLLHFQSLKELVFHFRDHSLKDYNEKLDIKLTAPCGKPETLQIKDEDKKMAKERFLQLSEKLREIKCIEFKVEEQYQQFDECKCMSESQTDVVNFLEEQISLAELQYQEATSQDKQDLVASLDNLNKILFREKTIWKELDECLLALNQEYNQLKAQMNELSTELPLLREEYNQLEPKMKEMFPEEYKKEEEEEDIMDAIYDSLPAIVQRNSDDLEDKHWLFGHLEKLSIQTMLENKPDGTFLVRKSRNFPYVISLVHDGLIKHIAILRGPNGYGFAEPHNTYKTLHALINHYHNQSLRLHNRNLDTTLRIPYKFLEHIGDEPIYD